MARFMGTETEYGISTPSDPVLSPIITSTHVVVAYAAEVSARRSRWDFSAESPLKDTRGFDLKRYHTVPVLDPNMLGVANLVTSNGARFYVDHAHPEYSSPETTNAWDAMVYDAAGDIILNQAVQSVRTLTAQGLSALDGHEPCPELKIYKNNVDGKGASYGSHENYLYSRDIDFDVLAQGLIPFFVTRQIIIGAGRVGIGQRGERPGFQISQRADYIEQQISLETTLNRGIINTRDEPHTDADAWGRLHVIIGDANMSQVSNFLKLGMTSLVIDAIEAGIDFSDLTLADPVHDVSAISHDLTLKHELLLADGRRLTAIGVLREYLERVRELAEGNVEKRVVALWSEVLELLDKDPLSTAHLLDWTAKLSLMKQFIARGLTWDDPKIQLIDLQYADIDPAKSLHHALVRKDRMTQLASAEEIARAIAQPPAETRAYFRGKMMSEFGSSVAAASWDAVVVDAGDKHLRIPTTQLDGLTSANTAEVFAAGDITNALTIIRDRQLAEIQEV